MKLLNNYPEINNLTHLTPPENDFEAAYLEARIKEGRLYPDEIVKQLPYLPLEHPQAREWKLRQHNVKLLLEQLKKQPKSSILDLGCGNGWLTHQLVTNEEVQVLGMDINTPELEQANRIFASDQCSFAYGDIFKATLPEHSFDLILLVSCIQYFPDLSKLMHCLTSLLSPGGELHIMDSPIYAATQVAQAKSRTKAYYQEQGSSSMKDHYHHHCWEALSEFSYQLQYNPSNLTNKVLRKLGATKSPFPWVIISKP
ncbi:class I SAM-dependent methyltransferase [Lewinella cohaerens]|uniref:class I SAM-dependent methyltransferase n=1 Tax=Lewinella cohaerens TaxID=70995 RepID=UPI0003622C58|nr:class I SAM-dependent methyltransferase [Lewinella cohaerens]